jgi:hypothetical protein
LLGFYPILKIVATFSSETLDYFQWTIRCYILIVLFHIETQYSAYLCRVVTTKAVAVFKIHILLVAAT